MKCLKNELRLKTSNYNIHHATLSINVSWNKSNHVPSTNSRILGTKYWLLLITFFFFFRKIDTRFLKTNRTNVHDDEVMRLFNYLSGTKMTHRSRYT